MSIDAGVVRIAVVFLPGILARMVSLRMRASKQRGIWEDFLDILIFAFASYALAAILAVAMHGLSRSGPLQSTTTPSTAQAAAPTAGPSILPENFSAVIDNKPINWGELLIAMAFSVGVGAVAAASENHKVVNRLGRVLGLTKTFGDDDVWSYLNNSSDYDWVYVRDFRKQITYYGHIRAFSDSYKTRELVLTEVRVFDNQNGNEIDSLPTVYLSFPDNDITIEIPQIVGRIPDEMLRPGLDELLDTSPEKLKKLLLWAYPYDQKREKYILRKRLCTKKRVLIQAQINSLNALKLQKETTNG